MINPGTVLGVEVADYEKALSEIIEKEVYVGEWREGWLRWEGFKH